MKALIILLLAGLIFGGAYLATDYLIYKPKREMSQEKLQPPPPPLPDPSLPDFEHCLALQDSKPPLEVQAAWRQFLDQNPHSSRLDEAKENLGRINVSLFLSPIETPDKMVYEVKRNDVITRVAARNNSTPELIMRSNNLRQDMLMIGQRLLIAPADFSLRIDRRAHKVELLQGGKFFKQYPILVVPTPHAHAPEGKPVHATPRPAKIMGKVSDKVSWHQGQRVIFTEKGFWQAEHWIVISPNGHSLYTESPAVEGVPPLQKPPGGGYGLPPDAMQELAAMLRKSDPVVIE